MSDYQVYLYEDQKKYLIKYVEERRYQRIINLRNWGVITVLMFIFSVPCFFDIKNFNSLLETLLNFEAEQIFFMITSFVFFVKELIIGLKEKQFGVDSDMRCIENDCYTLSNAPFGYRDKNPFNKHPYYMTDFFGNKFICPNFLDWRDADKDTVFLYIKLENGRGYAIIDKETEKSQRILLK